MVKIVLLSGPILFILLSVILGKITPHYSWKDNYLSELAIGKYGIIQRLNFFICGISIIGLGILLASGANDPIIKLAGKSTILYGITVFLAGVWNTDAKGDQNTKTGKLHNWTFYLGMAAINLVFLLISWASRSNLVVSTLSWAIVIFNAVAWLSSKKLGVRDGITQRAVIFLTLIWLEFISLWASRCG